MAALAVDDDCGVFHHRAEDMRSDAVFLLFGVVPRQFASGIAPRLLDHLDLADEVGAFESAFFVSSFEDEAVPQVEGVGIQGSDLNFRFC